MDPDLERRLSQIEARLGQLEQQGRPLADPTFWALEALQARATEGGELLYAGTVTLPSSGRYQWQIGAGSARVLNQPWTGAAPALAALGHPVRLELLRAVLLGRSSSAELAALPGIGTSGQLYHHLHELTGVGWLRQEARGRYAVPAERIIPLLITVLAADTLELTPD